MSMLRMGVCVGAIAAAALTGCATAPSSGGAKRGPVERASESRPYDFRSEGEIPPLGETRNEPDVEEMGITPPSVDVTDAEAPVDTTPPPVPPQETLIDGFRVQVFATGDREIADNAARVARERSGLPAYVELEGGMYKVRVGDFAARAEADAALAGVRRHYADAWIVASKIRALRTR